MVGSMATITLKNVPEPLVAALKERAAAHRRSLNREVIDCLGRALTGKPLDTHAFLARVRRLRASTPGQIDDSLIRHARETGRP